jgi:hypothetical protein
MPALFGVILGRLAEHTQGDAVVLGSVLRSSGVRPAGRGHIAVHVGTLWLTECPAAGGLPLPLPSSSPTSGVPTRTVLPLACFLLSSGSGAEERVRAEYEPLVAEHVIPDLGSRQTLQDKRKGCISAKGHVGTPSTRRPPATASAEGAQLNGRPSSCACVYSHSVPLYSPDP